MPSENRIKKFREERGWTQQQCARVFGVDQSQVSRWERGVQPIPAMADKLVKCLRRIEELEGEQ